MERNSVSVALENQVLVAIIPQAQAQYFDFETKEWKPLPSMAQLTDATTCFCAEYAGNHLYVAAKKEEYFVMYRYDTVSNTWETLSPILGCEHKIDSLCTIDDYIYAIRESQPPHRCSLKTNQLQCIRSFSTSGARLNTFCSKASVVFNSCLFVLQGLDTVVRYNRDLCKIYDEKPAMVQCFDPELNEWKSKASTNSSHFGSSLFVVNGRLCIAGGTGFSGAPVEIYDEQNKKWSYVEQSRIPQNNLGAVEIEGRVYFIINNFPVDSGIRIPSGEKYPVPLDEWENLRKVNSNAVLCYLPVRNESLKAE
ncbi:kelch-like ECH-associated protein 1 [Stylophora pistillata]|uniref:kelch-like ECH-associated protein 1 n=1 Tax=Stylophora pistillata TaxID=50429 RepID=UPI000C04455E|nr:kelch-like ECH-associated protein 1 [Stylophora pistillata]